MMAAFCFVCNEAELIIALGRAVISTVCYNDEMPLCWMETLIRQLKFAKKIKDYDVNSYSTYYNPDMENNVCVLFEQQLISWTTLIVDT